MKSISNQKSVVIVCPSPSDATSWYRGIGPWGDLKIQMGEELVAVFSKEINWTTFAMSHGLFLQRPFREDHVQMIEIAKNFGRWVWVDYDDDLFNVPSHNPTWDMYGRASTKLNIMKCLHLADQITVSTAHLAQVLTDEMMAAGIKDPAEKIAVVRNALPQHLCPQLKKMKEGRNDVVLWRGSKTHQLDIASVAKHILSAFENNPKWVFNFVGDRPWFLADKVDQKRFVFSEGMDVGDFMNHIQTISPKVMIVPLEDDLFNRSKSNIAWLEGTMAGALVVAPFMNEWKQNENREMPNIINYEQGEDFGRVLEIAMTMPAEERVNRVQRAQAILRDHHTLGTENFLRRRILEHLCSKNDY